MIGKYKVLLGEYGKYIKDEIQMIESGARLAMYQKEIKPREKQLKKELMELAFHIAKTGQVQPDMWIDVRNYFVIFIKDTLDRFQAEFKDSKTFEEEKEVILQYLVFFEHPPFTIQRIAELTLEPEKYYKSSHKLLYAYEKLVNVADPEEK